MSISSCKCVHVTELHLPAAHLQTRAESVKTRTNAKLHFANTRPACARAIAAQKRIISTAAATAFASQAEPLISRLRLQARKHTASESSQLAMRGWPAAGILRPHSGSICSPHPVTSISCKRTRSIALPAANAHSERILQACKNLKPIVKCTVSGLLARCHSSPRRL